MDSDYLIKLAFLFLFVVNQNWENVIQRMKTGLEEQEEVLAQMEKDIVTKESEITEYRLKIEELIKTIADRNEKVEKLSEENEHLDHQKEKLKIKVFELETEVQKLQQDVKKESSKKDTATQALRDGLEIVKTKKVEYERKMNAITTEMEEMKSVYEEKVKELEGEIERLKSVNSETGEKTVSVSMKHIIFHKVSCLLLSYFHFFRLRLRRKRATGMVIVRFHAVN